MQSFALIYYIASLIIGVASILCLVPIVYRTRNPFFIHYLAFSAFYSLLIFLTLFSLYMEVNHAAWHSSNDMYLRLSIFCTKCCLAYALAALTQRIFNVGKTRIINPILILILFLGLVLRLLNFFNIVPESAEGAAAAIPISRIIVDALIVWDLAYLFLLRFFRLGEIAQAEFQQLMKRIALIIACFAPPLIVEIIFYERWGIAVVTPAMYCVVSLVFLISISAYFGDHYRVSGAQTTPLDSFAHKYGISDREREIAASILRGNTNRMIADHLFISPSTVKAHAYSIFKKAGVRTRHQLIFKIINKE